MSSADTPETAPTDAAREALLRELYWAQEATPLGRLDTQRVRDEPARLRRPDARGRAGGHPARRAEPRLASRWRRQLKLRVFRFMRPVCWRYDRLLADHAELTTQLAERLRASEAEVERLRARSSASRPATRPRRDGASR